MPSGLRGYNIYLDGVKVNALPIPEGQALSLSGADPGSDYSARITISAIDNAGNEATPVSIESFKGAGSVVTQSAPPTQSLSNDIKSQIDSLVAAKIKPTPDRAADGCMVGISTPGGNYYKAYGGDRTPNAPIHLGQNFRYGSCSKMFCHTLILREIDRGHLNWDDTVDQFVDDIPNGDKITVRQLLLFQDGLKDWLQDDAATQQAYFLNPTSSFDPLAYIRASTPMFEPGTSSKYSNSATFVLGAILEWCDAEYGTGRTVDQIIVQDWKAEVGLDSLHWPTTNNMNAPYVRGWTPNLALPQIQAILGPFAFLAGLFGYPTSKDLEWTAVSTSWAGAAGSLAGNMADFVKVGQALYGGAFLSDEMKVLQKEIFTTYVFYEPAGPYQGPGWMGFGLNAIRWGSWRGWVGNLGGYIAVLFYSEADGSVIATMLNNFAAHADCVDLFYQIAYLLDPASTQHVPWHYRPDFIDSTAEVFSPAIRIKQAPGDEDNKTDIPLKVPFRI
ncbi:minor tail protein [Mycobacterium phage ThreeRngTarjay]|uniref:minor tail protein with lysin activity n=1 Tax=Mycobacterium phage Redno2 TaxID=1340709 RepID=UPI000387AAA7|nr:minor tail protein with lysin activity [Mycobacterium phage Redno2]ATN89755.1 minor tail protein [Mycobacterium phage Klein]AXQ52277.1 minor tail protein [Mycobacterium phage EricMillard]AXQ62448.1 minor tail protein [Mycobacterium phage Zelink]AYB69527.1 minor tail protein [Mycobacterium phage Kalah2]QBI99678.1 minor tail protein [Mycobacterium phage ThreeRngTarjay]QBI99989.1 minor tail protein [Mycobacterium phage Phoebus]QDM55621.1 minor tail protein [Mycobacterium phage HokkenD]QDP43